MHSHMTEHCRDAKNMLLLLMLAKESNQFCYQSCITIYNDPACEMIFLKIENIYAVIFPVQVLYCQSVSLTGIIIQHYKKKSLDRFFK